MNKLEFLNQTKDKYDWDNDDIKDDDGLTKEDHTHPNLYAKISPMDLEDECMDPEPAIEEEVVDDTTRATTACTNTNIPGNTVVSSHIKGANLTSKLDASQEATHQEGVDAIVVENVDEEGDDEDEEDNNNAIPPFNDWSP